MSALRRRPQQSLTRDDDHFAENASERQHLFNRIAPVYDKLNDVFSLGLHRLWKKWTIAWTDVKEGDKALDVCCGSGDLAFRLSHKVGLNGKVIGLDFSRELLQVAASRQRDKSSDPFYKNIEWIEEDATKLPFPNESFDAATIGYGLRNIVDRKKAMEEVCRVLKTGSKVSVLDFNKSTYPILNFLQGLMIDYLVVPVASWYGLTSEYRYLKKSINEYLTGNELEQLALEAGFSEAKHYAIHAGFMGILVAKR